MNYWVLEFRGFAAAVWGIAAGFKIQVATFSMASGDIVSSISPYSPMAPVLAV
jgi:hypothetical protein